MVSPTARAARELFGSLDAGSSIYVQGSSGEARTFCYLITDDSGLREPSFFASLVPGLNSFDYAAPIPGARLTTLLLPPALRSGFEAGRVRVWPVSYARAAKHLAS
jgi:hypothetical protein